MNIRKNARLTRHSRADLVRRVVVEGQASMAVATAMDVSAKTVRKWVERFAAEGAAGLADRSSKTRRKIDAALKAKIALEALREQSTVAEH